MFMLVLSVIQITAQPIIYRPGPGLNDGTDEGGLSGGKDALSRNYNPSLNFGNSLSMDASGISNCNTWWDIAYIQFDLTTLPSTVDSVFVGFTHHPDTNYCYSGCNADFYFAAVTASWNEMTLTSDTHPAYNTAFYGPVNITFPNNFGTKEYNITAMYNLWKSGTVTNYGMAIYSPTVDCLNAAVLFNVSTSDDTIESNRPYLKIYSQFDGIQDHIYMNEFNIYPNPSNNELNAEFNLNIGGKVIFQLNDITGREVMKECKSLPSGNAAKMSISVSKLTPGMYLYNIQTPNKLYSGKFIHQ